MTRIRKKNNPLKTLSMHCDDHLKNDDNSANKFGIQSWTFAVIQLVNKPYENEVTLTGQNPPLKCC